MEIKERITQKIDKILWTLFNLCIGNENIRHVTQSYKRSKIELTCQIFIHSMRSFILPTITSIVLPIYGIPQGLYIILLFIITQSLYNLGYKLFYKIGKKLYIEFSIYMISFITLVTLGISKKSK